MFSQQGLRFRAPSSKHGAGLARDEPGQRQINFEEASETYTSETYKQIAAEGGGLLAIARNRAARSLRSLAFSAARSLRSLA